MVYMVSDGGTPENDGGNASSPENGNKGNGALSRIFGIGRLKRNPIDKSREWYETEDGKKTYYAPSDRPEDKNEG